MSLTRCAYPCVSIKLYALRASDATIFLDGMSKALADSLLSTGILSMTAFPTRLESAMVPDELEGANFKSLVDYSEDARTHTWVAMKDSDSRGLWFGRSQASAELAFRQRMVESSYASLLASDSARSMAYKFPPRASEAIWCSQHQAECGDGHGFDPLVPNIPISAFQVKHSGVGERAGRGVYARQLIPEGSMMALDMCVYGMHLPPQTYSVYASMYLRDDDGDREEASDDADNDDNYNNDLVWKPLHGYVDGYGWVDNDYVRMLSPPPPAVAGRSHQQLLVMG